MMMHNGMWGMGPGMMIAMAVVALIPAWRICVKAEFSGWIGLLAIVPIANVVLLDLPIRSDQLVTGSDTRAL